MAITITESKFTQEIAIAKPLPASDLGVHLMLELKKGGAGGTRVA